MASSRCVAMGLVVLGFLAALGFQGCGRSESYGTRLALSEVTPVAAVLRDPASHVGKTVRVEGRIVTECPSGCWFEVGDGAAILYVDIAPAGLAIPQRVGRAVVVEGTVAVQDGRPTLLGKGVEIL